MSAPHRFERLQAMGIARESGAVMVVALIMLLALTLLGATTSRLTLLEERMTGNAQDQSVAFQVAEAALRVGENSLRVAVLPEFDGTEVGHYQPADPINLPVWETIDFDSAAAAVAYDGLEDAPGSVSAATASYIIEELPRVPVPGESLRAGAPVDEPAFFRVTARGVGVAGNAQATLQTTYKR